MNVRPPTKTTAFSLVELLVAMAIGAAVITVGVMIFANLGAGGRPTSSHVTLNLGTATVVNLYPTLDQATVDAPVAPHYGSRAQADRLRDLFWEDVEKSAAVFCLGRAGLNDKRPVTVSVSADFAGPQTAMPNDFRAVLESVPATFVDYRGALTSPNASIFLLRPSAGPDEVLVQAIYEIDQVPTTSPNPVGTYVSVRRTSGGATTDYYSVFYPDRDGITPFSPLVVAFERLARAGVPETTVEDRLKVAPTQPFYFVWWPDPAVADLKSATLGSYAVTNPQASYPNMGGRTSLFFVVPMFPAL
ncbi:MAG: prepilin-type N-terminal cleavage/methylation domain-containing protein [Chthoniobacterales bacterium]